MAAWPRWRRAFYRPSDSPRHRPSLGCVCYGGMGNSGNRCLPSDPCFLRCRLLGALFPKSDRPRLFQLLWMRWIGESISALVPSAAVGGDIVRARLAAIQWHTVAGRRRKRARGHHARYFYSGWVYFAGIVSACHRTGKTSFVGPTLIGIVVALFAFPASTLCSDAESSVFSLASFRVWPVPRIGNPSCKAAIRWTEPSVLSMRGGVACSHACFAPWPPSSSAREKFGLRFGRSICLIHS